MTTYSGDIRERLKDLIETYVTVFKSTQDYPGTVYDKQPMTLIRAVLPVAMIIERPTTYTKSQGNRTVSIEPSQFEVAFFIQEWTVETSVNFDFDRIDQITSEFENLITKRPLLESEAGEPMGFGLQARLLRNDGVIGRLYPPREDIGTWYVVKSFTIQVYYNRST